MVRPSGETAAPFLGTDEPDDAAARYCFVRGARKIQGIFGFLPFLCFILLSSRPEFAATLALACALAINACNGARKRLGDAQAVFPCVLDAGYVVVFALLLATLAAGVYLPPQLLGTLATGGLLLITLASMAIGTPLTSQYGNERVPPVLVGSPPMTALHMYITAYIGACFVFATGSQFAYLAAIGLRTAPDKSAPAAIACTLVLPLGVWLVALPRIPRVVALARRRVDFAGWVAKTEGAAAQIAEFYERRAEPNPFLPEGNGAPA
jgi:hypothetical protein